MRHSQSKGILPSEDNSFHEKAGCQGTLSRSSLLQSSSHSAKPPLSQSFHSHSFVSDIRSVPGWVFAFRRCYYLTIDLSSYLRAELGPGVDRSCLDSVVEFSCSEWRLFRPRRASLLAIAQWFVHRMLVFGEAVELGKVLRARSITCNRKSCSEYAGRLIHDLESRCQVTFSKWHARTVRPGFPCAQHPLKEINWPRT